MTYFKHKITGEIRSAAEISIEQLATWENDGNPKAGIWETYVFPDVIPTKTIEITNRQFRLALPRVTGVFPSAVTAAITSIQNPAEREDALSEWEYSNSLLRTSPLLLVFASKFGVDDSQLDAIFELGATL